VISLCSVENTNINTGTGGGNHIAGNTNVTR
jgi:hypothetical protein